MRKLYLILSLYAFIFTMGAPLHELLHSHAHTNEQEGVSITQIEADHQHNCEACGGCAHSGATLLHVIIITPAQHKAEYRASLHPRIIRGAFSKIEHPPD